MQSNGSRIVALLVALAVIVALFFAFRGGEDDSTTSAATDATEATTAATTTDEQDQDGGQGTKQEPAEPEPPLIRVAGGEPQGGVAELEYDKGERIRFSVKSDVPDEVHVHGYDVEEEVPAGEVTTFDFAADLEGVFEVELHESGAQIAEITVNP
ncbi:MAG TPA: hypothetical protein VFH44_09145 [Solirubrobacterales bacterium]|nr:hypothetical protein [Solirubrobacterales bacterium]